MYMMSARALNSSRTAQCIPCEMPTQRMALSDAFEYEEVDTYQKPCLMSLSECVYVRARK